jgi:serine O-acetyltransferase
MGTVIHADTRIGDDAIIGHNVTIGNGGAVIGNRVTIGAGAIVIGAVRVGDDATIGANTVVTKDVPPGATVVGARSRIIARGG